MTIVRLNCAFTVACTATVTHIGDKGFVYCAEHAPLRRNWERCRKLRQWELSLVRNGEPVPSYKPISRARAAQLRTEYEANKAAIIATAHSIIEGQAKK